jgi:hypothetical protein
MQLAMLRCALCLIQAWLSGCTSVETESNSGTAGSGGNGGSSPCDVLECPAGQRCGYELCPGCNLSPVCATVQPCQNPRSALRCSDDTRVDIDCETGLFPEPVWSELLTDCML